MLVPFGGCVCSYSASGLTLCPCDPKSFYVFSIRFIAMEVISNDTARDHDECKIDTFTVEILGDEMTRNKRNKEIASKAHSMVKAHAQAQPPPDCQGRVCVLDSPGKFLPVFMGKLSSELLPAIISNDAYTNQIIDALIIVRQPYTLLYIVSMGR